MTSPLIIAGLAAASLLAGFVRGATGFGGALALAPFFAVLLDPKLGVEIIILICALSAMQGLGGYWQFVRWRRVLPLALVAIVATQLFGRVVAGMNSVTNRRAIGYVILTMALLHLSGWKWRHKGGVFSTLAAGLFSGAFTAIAGAGGPPAVVYFAGDSKESLRGNLLSYFVILYAFAALGLAIQGRATRTGVLASLALTPLFIAGSIAGERVYLRLAGAHLDRAVATVLAASGLLLALR